MRTERPGGGVCHAAWGGRHACVHARGDCGHSERGHVRSTQLCGVGAAEAVSMHSLVDRGFECEALELYPDVGSWHRLAVDSAKDGSAGWNSGRRCGIRRPIWLTVESAGFGVIAVGGLFGYSG